MSKKVIARLQSEPKFALTFKPITLTTTRIFLYSEASSENENNLGVQLVFLILIADDNNKANILHYASSR